MKKIIFLIFLIVSFLGFCIGDYLPQRCVGENQFSDPCGICAPGCINGEFQLNYYKVCTEGCACANGYILDDNMNCIPLEKCNGVPKCPPNKEYISCGPSCTSLCDNGVLLLFKCIACCTPGCFCKPGFIRNEKDECIKECKPNS